MAVRRAVLVLAIVVAAAGCAHTGSSPDADETSTPKDMEQQNNTVFFTGSGFQPSSLTIEQGETVTWLDRSGGTMWIASDRHPTHREYAGTSRSEHCGGGDQVEAAFDQCSTGDRFTFTFEKAGTWGYHNHQRYVPGGTITVR